MKRSIVATVSLLVLAGCSLVLGKAYSRYDHVPGGMGVIYLYGSDVVALQQVHVDREPETDGITHTISMIQKGYYPYLVRPGLVRVLSGPSDSADCVMIPVQANSFHWVRVSKNQPRVEALDRAAGEKEIAGHREISRESRELGSGSYPAADCPLAETGYQP